MVLTVCDGAPALHREEFTLRWDMALSSLGHKGHFALDKPATMDRGGKGRPGSLFGRAPPVVRVLGAGKGALCSSTNRKEEVCSTEDCRYTS
jgi:hypothetical protein